MTSRNADGPHYSPFVIGGGLVFVSGQLPFRPGRDTSLAAASVGVQTEQALANLKAVLESAGVGPAQVVKTTVYLTDMKNWGEIDAAYRAFFGAARRADRGVDRPAALRLRNRDRRDRDCRNMMAQALGRDASKALS